MGFGIRSMRSLSRHYRNLNGISSYRSVTGAAFKEEINTELLNSFNRDIKAGGVVPVFRRALLFPSRVALQDEVGIYTYAGLYQAAITLSNELAAKLSGDGQHTIAYMCTNDASHVIVQWAIWMSGNIAVPLTPLHPEEMLKYFVSDSEAKLIVCTQDYAKILQPVADALSKPLIVTSRDKEITAQLYQPNSSFLKPKSEGLEETNRSNMWYSDKDALIIYTSGTTSKPKGVVWTHAMLQTQLSALHTAWQYSSNDVVLHTLPLHHIHGQLNSLNASLAAGARIRMLPSFVAHTVWARLLAMGERDESKVTVFHGVPSMYAKLASAHEQMFASEKTASYVRATLEGRMRLMCAGSAPLPHTLAKKWYQISGVRLLERYGMTEAGMALSNPYRPAAERAPGCVGRPLPGVSARVAVPAPAHADLMQPLVTVETPMSDEQICLKRLGATSTGEYFVESDNFEWKDPVVTYHTDSQDNAYNGELLLKGPGIFSTYWRRVSQLNFQDFTPDGWFRTGDTAYFNNNKFYILGRTSVDIIKTGGYKVSALQIESAILEHPAVADAAVVGVEDEHYGEIVAAAVVLKPNTKLSLRELKDDAGKRLAPYQLPKTLIILDQIPRNVMGKLDKKEIKRLYADKLTLKKLR